MVFDILSRTVKKSTGRINQETQEVYNWQESAIDYTSNFVTNIHNKIASEVAKVNFNHVKYTINTGGLDTMQSQGGSDIDEVLNWKPKGYNNSVEFWTVVIKRMMLNRVVRLVPSYREYNGIEVLDDLRLLDSDAIYNEEETVNLFSPFFVSKDTSILDNALDSIVSKLNQGKMRALLKINAQIDTTATEFKEKTEKVIRAMQETSNYNGIGAMDAKSSIVELKKDYSVLNQEEIDLIKSELLSSYFMNEKVLLGTASQEEQMLFYNSTIIPLLNQIEKELTYKLLSTQARRITPNKQQYQRILIDNNILKFASIKDLISFYHENTQAPTKTVNELRVLMGDQPIEGGDVYMTNLNSYAITDFAELANSNPARKENDETNSE